MIIIHHSKDMDGYCSGAICKLKYPEAELIGWDYKDPIPDFEQFRGQDVIMIDITFPIEKLKELGRLCSQLTVIDHHISFKKEYDERVDAWDSFLYVYKDRKAACEIGWTYLFPDKPLPHSVLLIGRYDTWRQEEGDWKEETLPFKYYMYGQCNSAESFPKWVLQRSQIYDMKIETAIDSGKDVMKYQEMIDESATRAYSFEKEAYGYRALVLNVPYFNSESLKTRYNPENHDIMIGFCYTGSKWSVSLRSAKSEVDCSIIAKQRGGGGHKGAAGFEAANFEDIFK